MGIVLKKIQRPIRAHIGGKKQQSGSKLPQYNSKRPPCSVACPSSEDIRGYLTMIAQSEEYLRSHEESMEQAWHILTDKNPMPAIMGRVCPHPCEGGCNRKDKDTPVNINKMELAIGEFGRENKLALKKLTTEKTGKKVAIIGSGPAGISCAYQLARRGHSVTLFESKPEVGGMLRYGIPAYRLPRDIIQSEYQRVFDLGVELKVNTKIGKDISMDQVKSEYDAVFIGIGAQTGWTLGLEGEDSSNVYAGADFLLRHNLEGEMETGDKVVVVGGGDTAMDVARSCRRMGANVSLVYRRGRDEMPAIAEDIVGAEEEGVDFQLLTNPTKLIVENGKVVAIECIKMELGEPDESGRRRPQPVAGSEFQIEATCLVSAISQGPDFEGLEEFKNEKGWISMGSEEGRFSEDNNVWVGGDVSRQLGLVTEAVGDGRIAAEDIDRFLLGKEKEKVNELPIIYSSAMHMQHYPDLDRNSIGEKEPAARLTNFDEYIIPFDVETTVAEAKRCMSCGQCWDCDNCWSFCGEGAVDKLEKGQHYKFKWEKCIGCEKCAQECPCGLIDMI